MATDVVGKPFPFQNLRLQFLLRFLRGNAYIGQIDEVSSAASQNLRPAFDGLWGQIFPSRKMTASLFLTSVSSLTIFLQWTADGDAFKIGSDLNKLESETLPQYFRHNRFQSLVRQLNFYNVSLFLAHGSNLSLLYILSLC